MTQEKYENLLFFVTVANILLGTVSVVLGMLAIVAIRQCKAVEQALVKKAELKALVPWDQRPQATLQFHHQPVIRPSVLAETRRRFQDDIWG